MNRKRDKQSPKERAKYCRHRWERGPDPGNFKYDVVETCTTCRKTRYVRSEGPDAVKGPDTPTREGLEGWIRELRRNADGDLSPDYLLAAIQNLAVVVAALLPGPKLQSQGHSPRCRAMTHMGGSCNCGWSVAESVKRIRAACKDCGLEQLADQICRRPR